ncbi:hypothetical protein GCM10020358_81480 [Amorphoplanes nipponensis]|uniref:Uncharacterized protein n=1 Tax=Actinoplanes nipponensis TaxID=135950 RepID=A0A919JDI9_9ACTN|nr:hypothetical protein [Actinoplanes nipponensis]GIE49019.1 hypothetical protein Ani05nite_25530 [Actinoplanes nipponensis]
MAAAADLTAAVLAVVAGLGVPWWGWTALFVMIFFGLLVPRDEETRRPEELFPDRR